MPDPKLPLSSLESFRPLWPLRAPCLSPLPAARFPLGRSLPSIVWLRLFRLAQVLQCIRLSAEGWVCFTSLVLQQQQQMPRSSQEEKDEKEKEKEKEGEKEEDKQETENDKEELTK